MTPLEIQQELARWKFWPGFEFTIHEIRGFPPSLCLRLEGNLPDSNDPETSIPVKTEVPLPDCDRIDRTVLARMCSGLAYTAANHEVKEWLRRDGVRIEEPHTQGARSA